MAVYVDDMRARVSVPNGARTVTGHWSHLLADSHDEPVAFAKIIGLRVSWIQHQNEPGEHFDVTDPKRLAALHAGAISLPTRSQAWMDRFESSRRQRPYALNV